MMTYIRCKLCLLVLTKVFGLENDRVVGNGKICPNSQNRIKIVTTINNKWQENGNSKLKRRSADLKKKSKYNIYPRYIKHYKLWLHDRHDARDIDSLKVTSWNTGGP